MKRFRSRGEDGAYLERPEEPVMLFDCPECGLPATVASRGQLAGTSGAVEHVDVHCVADHRFMGPADTLRVLLSR